MAENSKIKVVGYAKKQVFNGDIEYRNFSDDLVGLQQTDGASTFTLGNFNITTTLDAKPSKIFITNKFSNFVSLCELDLSVEESQILLDQNSNVRLKLDKTNPCNYAYFGSFLEYVRVSLEEIITKWPASLYVTPNKGTSKTELTVEDYLYDPLVDECSFKINTDIIRNPYQINYLENGTILDTFNEDNDMRNLTVNFSSYSVLNGDDEYDVLNFTGATSNEGGYIYLKVKGNVFNDLTGTTGTTMYHIKPNKTKEEVFYNLLPDFQSNLLNRLTVPKFSSTYRFPERTETGNLVFKTKTLTWPTTDGYNIDFNSTDYTEYVADLIEIATDFDENKTNLMVRFLTAEAISDFDTVPRCDGNQEETAGQKMNRTLKIYGREYDEVKRYIDGIQFANTVTYDQKDNTPDAVLKYIARTMGWEMAQSVLENDLLKNYVTTAPSSYSGMSRGYTPLEAEIEMWRRLILNTPWTWKSKGARKAIEFMFKFIGAPDGLVEFNEFIYLAKDRIDVDLFKLLLEANDLPTEIDLYPIDSDGYPRVPNNTPDMYFQKGGLWYRQTAGTGATIDTLVGNNPHVGPYDGGAAFINQFNNLIPNFSATTLTSTTVTSDSTQLFTNYENGTINSYEGDYFIDILSTQNADLEDCVVVTTEKVPDPYPTASEITECGCEVEEEDFALMINVGCDFAEGQALKVSCDDKLVSVKQRTDGAYLFFYKKYDEFGNEVSGNWSSPYNSRECCRAIGGTPVYDEEWSTTDPTHLINAGYICCTTAQCGCSVTCDWTLATTTLSEMPLIDGTPYLLFEKPNGQTTTITPTGCSCIAGYTTAVQITDPNTGESGIGCMLNKSGVGDLIGESNVFYYTWINPKTNEPEVRIFKPLFNDQGDIINYPTEPIYSSFIEAVYEGRANGGLPCGSYMNNEAVIDNTGVPIDDDPTISTNVFITKR
jgi:hypothetical protein